MWVQWYPLKLQVSGALPSWVPPLYLDSVPRNLILTMKSNQEWLSALKAEGSDQEKALKELRKQLLRVILAYLGKHATSGALGREEARQIAEDCAQESLLLIRANLATFRGESQFTTWAYAIALRATLGELRRRRWRQVKLSPSLIGQVPSDLPLSRTPSPAPDQAAQQEQAWSLLSQIIKTELTERQRTALVAHAFQEMPLDTVAELLGTNRDNVYKLIHDARKKLKRSLLGRGLTHGDILKLF
jgi:RNA polymerase sigma-70 factor (ECF subfamily)